MMQTKFRTNNKSMMEEQERHKIFLINLTSRNKEIKIKVMQESFQMVLTKMKI